MKLVSPLQIFLKKCRLQLKVENFFGGRREFFFGCSLNVLFCILYLVYNPDGQHLVNQRKESNPYFFECLIYCLLTSTKQRWRLLQYYWHYIFFREYRDQNSFQQATNSSVPGICTIWIVWGSGLLSITVSAKLSVDAAWRYFPASSWCIIYCCFLVTKSVSKLEENFKMIKYLKLEGRTKV